MKRSAQLLVLIAGAALEAYASDSQRRGAADAPTYNQEPKPKSFTVHIQKTGLGQFTIHTLAHCSGVARQVCGGDQCCDKFFFAPQRNVSLYVLCDVDELNPHTGHFFWNRKYAPHGIVTLREPAKQVVSAFGFGGGHIPPFTGIKEAQAWWRGNLTRYALFPQRQSCQTKMLLGYACYQEVQVPPDGVERAAAILRTDFKFVGMTDDFARTALLYCTMFVGGRSGCPCLDKLIATKPIRKGTTSSDEALLALARELMQNDPDYAVYHAGRRIYRENLCAHGLLPPSRCDLVPLIKDNKGRAGWSAYSDVVAAIEQ